MASLASHDSFVGFCILCILKICGNLGSQASLSISYRLLSRLLSLFLLSFHLFPVALCFVKRDLFVYSLNESAVQAKSPSDPLDAQDFRPHLAPGTLEQVHEPLAHDSSVYALADCITGPSQLHGDSTSEFSTYSRLDRDNLLHTSRV